MLTISAVKLLDAVASGTVVGYAVFLQHGSTSQKESSLAKSLLISMYSTIFLSYLTGNYVENALMSPFALGGILIPLLLS